MVPARLRGCCARCSRRGGTATRRTPATVAAELYGGRLRERARRGPAPDATTSRAVGSRRGYLLQLLAGVGWTSLPALPLIRQPTLILAGSDDPIIPLVNARIMRRLLPHATSARVRRRPPRSGHQRRRARTAGLGVLALTLSMVEESHRYVEAVDVAVAADACPGDDQLAAAYDAEAIALIAEREGLLKRRLDEVGDRANGRCLGLAATSIAVGREPGELHA